MNDFRNNKARRQYPKKLKKIKKMLKRLNRSSARKRVKAELDALLTCDECGSRKIISWGGYWRNQKMLRENAIAHGYDHRRPSRSGPALVQGIALCGRCGKLSSHVSNHWSGQHEILSKASFNAKTALSKWVSSTFYTLEKAWIIHHTDSQS